MTSPDKKKKEQKEAAEAAKKAKAASAKRKLAEKQDKAAGKKAATAEVCFRVSAVVQKCDGAGAMLRALVYLRNSCRAQGLLSAPRWSAL